MNLYLPFLVLTIALFAQEPAKDKPATQDCPMHRSAHSAPDDDHNAMNARGEHAMGFSQTATTHHFLITETGGVIEVESNSPDDKTGIASIRAHLSHIAKSFAAGDFDIPMFVHDTVPPGVPAMKRFKSRIQYSYEEISAGARVIISTREKTVREAVHSFLRFQIEEHRTGGPLT